MRYLKFIILIVVTSSLSGCFVYTPQLVDVPLIEKKHDIRLDGGVSSMLSAHGTATYGLSNKFAVQVAGNREPDYKYYCQAAGGYYKKFSEHGVFEVYTGFGFGYGNAYNFDTEDSLFLRGYYQVYFAQFNIGKVHCDFANTDFGFSLKGGLLNSYLYAHNYYVLDDGTRELNSFNVDNSLLIEPTAFVRFGGQKLKFRIIAGACLLDKLTNKERGIYYNNFNVGLGVSLTL